MWTWRRRPLGFFRGLEFPVARFRLPFQVLNLNGIFRKPSWGRFYSNPIQQVQKTADHHGQPWEIHVGSLDGDPTVLQLPTSAELLDSGVYVFQVALVAVIAGTGETMDANSRILKWRYCMVLYHISSYFGGISPDISP